MPAPAAAATAAGATVPNLESLDTLAETDPRAALLAASTQDLGPASTYVRGNLLQRWAERDFTAALAYADDFRPGPDREEMLGRLALLLAASLPAEAADIVAQDMAPGATRDEAAISVLHRWARADAASARTWAATFPPGRLRERALREVEGSVVAANAAP